MYWLKLGAGIVCGGLSVLWLVHVVLYVMLAPPLYPFLNTFFAKMDRVFPLFGTLAFAIACFYLIGESIAICIRRLKVCSVRLNRCIMTILSKFIAPNQCLDSVL